MKKNKKGNRKLPKYNGGAPGALSNTPHGMAPWYGLGTSSIQNGLAPTPQMSNITNGVKSGIPSFDISGQIGSAVDFAGSMINAFADPTLTGTNKTYMSKGPIQYQKTDYVNNKTEMDALKKQNTSNTLNTISKGSSVGASIGSIVPGVGTGIGAAVGAIGGAIGGIFGSRKRKRKLKRKIKNANENITNRNQFNLADVQSDMLEQDYYSDNENTQDDVLYNKGKTPFVNGKDANALVGKGETIVDGITGDMTEVTSGSAIGTDDVPAFIKQEDAIAGNKKNPRTGNTFAEDMKPLTRMESKLKRNNERNIKSIAENTERLVKAYTQPMVNSIIADQAAVIGNKNKAEFANGKQFGSKVLEYGGSALNTLGALAPSIWNIIRGTEEPETTRPDQLYATNAYAQPALSRMAKRRYNVNPELEAITGVERRQRYNARQFGSEGGIGRAMDIAGSLGVARLAGEAYAKKQNIDNDYIGQEASMMAQLGAQEAANRTSAMKESYEINARNRATQKAYQYAGLTGFANYAQQNELNRNKKRMDDARLRVLQNYYKLGTTNSNMDYILGPLMNG